MRDRRSSQVQLGNEGRNLVRTEDTEGEAGRNYGMTKFPNYAGEDGGEILDRITRFTGLAEGEGFLTGGT